MLRKFTAILILFVLLLAKVASIEAVAKELKINKAVAEQSSENDSDQSDEEKKNEKTEIDDFLHESPLVFPVAVRKASLRFDASPGIKIVHLSLPHPPPDVLS